MLQTRMGRLANSPPRQCESVGLPKPVRKPYLAAMNRGAGHRAFHLQHERAALYLDCFCNNSGSFAKFAAIRRASSFVSSLAALRRPDSSS